MKTIYLIDVGRAYEPSHTVCAFDNKVAADLFIEDIKNHEKKKPKERENFTDEEWGEYLKKEELWNLKHPAGRDGRYYDADDFQVLEIEVFTNPGSAKRKLRKDSVE